jgi:hypothetical protein
MEYVSKKEQNKNNINNSLISEQRNLVKPSIPNTVKNTHKKSIINLDLYNDAENGRISTVEDLEEFKLFRSQNNGRLINKKKNDINMYSSLNSLSLTKKKQKQLENIERKKQDILSNSGKLDFKLGLNKY